MENISINELAVRTRETLQELRLTEHTVWTE